MKADASGATVLMRQKLRRRWAMCWVDEAIDVEFTTRGARSNKTDVRVSIYIMLFKQVVSFIK